MQELKNAEEGEGEEDATIVWLPPKKHYCDICNIDQPYRTKHCKICNACVFKYDHHCFCVGKCIGKLNHRYFYLWMILEIIKGSWVFTMASQGFNSVDDQHTGAYGSYVIVMVIAFCVFMAAVGFFLFHTFLIFANMTSWEMMFRDTLSYFKAYKGSNPFYRGLWSNFTSVICHNGRIQEQQLPTPEELKKIQGFNWCNNKFWKCM